MDIRERRARAAVVGSGAAGLMTAIQLYRGGERDIVLVTENMNWGTSRNTGSDKQTYYKLSLAAGDMDSVRAMAKDLFAGQCVDGDQALCEAALSARGFFNLVELGVPFPSTEYGEFMGYQTDHDTKRRATSAGPYTSRLMTQCLEAEVRRLKIPVLDHMQAIRLLVREGRVYGLLCLEREREEEAYTILWAKNVVLATGGPAGMYHDSVYPASQLGASGIAFEAGAVGKNLTEWQFGLASLNPRWNVSGTYMQVLPRFISTDKDGGGEREFLMDYFGSREQMLSMVFLKGYQWPFDVNKIFGGSSVIDLLVYEETQLKGRRVFLDFTENPGGAPIPFERLSEEAAGYLRQAGAWFGTPVQRLDQMNGPAVQFYKEHGVDLYRQRLEIAVCAQHNNGGLAADAHWETSIRGLFAVGEACGSHGVMRPGGSALNAGQAGAMRAAEEICLRSKRADLFRGRREAERELKKEAEGWIGELRQAAGSRPLSQVWTEAAKRMSGQAGMIRSRLGLEAAFEETDRILKNFRQEVKAPSVSQLPLFYRLRDMLLSQKAYLGAMLDYAEQGGGSRGSALYTDPAGEKAAECLPELYRCRLDGGERRGLVQETWLREGRCHVRWRPVRPVPETDYFFENQWRAFRERNGIL